MMIPAGNRFGVRQTYFRFLCAGMAVGIVLAAGAAHADCINPPSADGGMFYNPEEQVFQYCDGEDWVAIHEPPPGGACDTTTITFDTPGTYSFEVPEFCSEITIMAYGGGGGGPHTITQRGGGGGGGASAAERASDSTLLVVAGGGGGGGGVEGDSASSSRGGGGAYAEAVVAVTPGEMIDIWVGGGGMNPNNDTGGNGGIANPYNGGRGANRRQNAVNDTVYGGGGGAGAEARGGDSVWGGAGGRGDDGGTCGVSVNGGACSTFHGGGGGGWSISGGTVIAGNNGGPGGGTAANGGPGVGTSGPGGGGPGLLEIVPAPGSGGPVSAPCDGPYGEEGSVFFNEDYGVMQGCAGGVWVAFGPLNPSPGAQCAAPAMPPGTIFFNQDCEVMQYCNGDDWIAMGKEPPFSC